MQDLRANTEVIVTVGPFVDVGDGFTPETGSGTLSTFDMAELVKHNTTTGIDISGRTWAVLSSVVDGYYNLTLTTTDTNTEGMLLVVMQDNSVFLPVKAEYMVLSEAAYDSKYLPKDDGFMDVNIRTVGRADTQETEANNLEAAFAVAAGAAGGVFIAGTNAATTVTSSFTTTFTGNLTGSVDSVTNAVGSVSGNVGGIAGVLNTLDDLDTAQDTQHANTQALLPALTSGTADSGSTTTMVDDALTEGDTDYWAGDWIRFTSGNVDGQTRLITGFTPGSDTITFAPVTTQAIAIGITYEIIPAAQIIGLEGTKNILDDLNDIAATAIVSDGNALNTTTGVLDVVNLTNTATTLTNNVAGIAGTINDLDALDTAQDTQHSTTQTDIAAVKTDTGNLITRIPAALFAGITSVAQWLGAMAGKQVANGTALTEIQATGAGSGGFDEATDSLEGIKDLGDSAWITSVGTSTLVASDIVSDGTALNTTSGVLDEVAALTGHTVQTGDTFAQLPTGFSTIVINSGAVDSLVQGFLNNTIAEGTGDNIANNFEVFFDNANSTSTSVIDDVENLNATIGAAGNGLTAINLPDQTMNIIGNITGNLSGSIGSLGATAKTDVNAEVVDVIKVDTMDEMVQQAMPKNPTMEEAYMYAYMALRNGVDVDKVGLLKEYRNDAAVVIHKKPFTDDGNVYAETKSVTGP